MFAVLNISLKNHFNKSVDRRHLKVRDTLKVEVTITILND